MAWIKNCQPLGIKSVRGCVRLTSTAVPARSLTSSPAVVSTMAVPAPPPMAAPVPAPFLPPSNPPMMAPDNWLLVAPYFRPSFLPAASKSSASVRRLCFVASLLAESIQPM